MLLFVIAALAVGGGWIWHSWQGSPDRPAPPVPPEQPKLAPDLAASCRLLAERLQQWNFECPTQAASPVNANEICHRYFGALASNQFKEDRLLLDLPEVAFVRRLPQQPIGEGVSFSSNAALRQELAHVAVHLGADESVATGFGVPELLGEIAFRMDYRRWVNREGRRDYLGQPDLLDPAVRRYVDHFR
jgi:hypothetical protein